MKAVKRLSVLLAVLLVLSIAVVGFAVSADDVTVITVTNEEEFNAAMVEANASATIVLANDITLTNGNTTMPGTFTGTFDGQGYTLAGMTQTLFNKLSGATVKNAKFDGAITSDNRKAATIAYDEQDDSVIKDIVSYVDITMAANDLNAGGIIGYGKSVTFENVTYAGDYVATWGGAGAGVGGIIGYTNNNGTANYINCAFTGTMTVNGEATGMLDLGAIIGIARNGENNFEGCVNAGSFTVTAPATTLNVSAVVGRNRDNSATISVKNCLNYGTASEGVTVAGVIASGEVAVDEGNVTAIPVATAEEFRAAMVEANNAAYIILTADIDLGTDGNTTMGGTFSGTFDGQGHTISGITAGLFAKIANGTVKNVTVNGAIAGNNRDIGTLTVRAEYSTIENVTSNVNITLGGEQGDLNAGGIVGYGKVVSFVNCTYAGTYTVENGGGGGFGGIVGYVNNDGKVSEYTGCTFSGNIVVNGTKTGTLNLGAIIGRAKSGALTISRPTNIGTITLNNAACGYNFGGIAGSLEDAGTTMSGAFVAPTVVKGEGVTKDMTLFYGNGTIASATGAGKMGDGSYLANDGEGLAAIFKYMPADATVKVNADMTLPAGTPTYTTGDFSGTLDGQGYTVSGITNTMFKKIVGGTVKNITLEGDIDYANNTPVIEARKASTLAGDAKNVTLENVICNVNITANAADLNAGGLIGYANEATFTNCTYGGTYTATGDGAVGAIAGYVRTNSGENVYTNCAFTGTINFDGVAEGKTVFIGGLVGKHRQATVTVIDANVTGTFNVTNNAGNVYVGGFMGTDNDVETLTMSGVFDGTINAPGATVDNFLAYDDKNAADLSGCVVSFDKGTIALAPDGAFLLGTESYSAFISVRDGAAAGTQDYRFVIVADGETYKAGTDVKLVLSFVKDGAVVKALTKSFADLKLYATATAAGNSYAAAEGCFLTGIVVTGVPADAWDTVTVTVVDGETALATGEVANADISEETLYTYTENSLVIADNAIVWSIAIETHHEVHNYNPAFVICLEGDLYKDIYSGGYNPNYTWYMSVNGGAEFVPASFSEYDGGDWGYLRAELGAAYADLKGYEITLVIVDNTTGEVVCYDDYYIHNDFIYDETKPENITVVAPEDITVTGGPNIGGGEGADKAFDGKHSTKVCTGDVGADNALIVELKNTINLKGVGICNANDNEGNTGRTVLAFEVYVSADGTNWGEPVYVATGEGLNKDDYSTNFMEIYYDFDAAVSAKFVKIVVNNDGLYQISDVLLYASTGTFMPENHLNFYFEVNSKDNSKGLVYWFHDNFGGADTVTKIANGEYILDLVIDGIEYKNVPASAAGRYLLMNIEALGVKGIKAGNYYDCSLTVRDTAGNRVYYNDPFSAGNYQRTEGCPYDLVPPAALEVGNYGIENHHADIDYRCAWVINTGDLKLCPAITDGTYTVAVMVNGVKTPITSFSLYGDNWVRMDLETAGVTGIVRGAQYTLQAIIYDADGYAVYETQVCEVTSNVFSTDIAAANVALPTTGIKEVEVNKETLSFEGISVWNAEKESIAQLFDGNTSTTKMGGNVGDERTVTLYFSLNEAATLAYYTLYTGNDTDTGSGRNPKDFVLYGKVGEDWVALSSAGFEAPTGMIAKRATPFNYAVTNPQACTEYKLVLTTDGQFQLNELKLYVADETVTAPTAAAAIGAAKAEVVLIHRNDWLKNEEGTKQFGLATKGDGNYIGGEAGLKTALDNPAYVLIKDVTAGGEYVRYEITAMETARHCDIRFNADGFTPEEGHTYDIILFIVLGEGNRYPAGTTYAIPAWGFQLGAAAKGY